VMISLTVNGKRRELEGEMTLTDFLAQNGVDLRRIAIGYNGQVVPKASFDRIMLKDGDVLEIVQMVGGG